MPGSAAWHGEETGGNMSQYGSSPRMTTECSSSMFMSNYKRGPIPGGVSSGSGNTRNGPQVYYNGISGQRSRGGALHLLVDVGALKDGLKVQPIPLHAQPRFQDLRHLGEKPVENACEENLKICGVPGTGLHGAVQDYCVCFCLILEATQRHRPTEEARDTCGCEGFRQMHVSNYLCLESIKGASRNGKTELQYIEVAL